MSELHTLAERMEAKFQAAVEKVHAFQSQQVDAYHGRQQRMERLEKVFEELREVWQPRLELLVEKFGEKVKVIPKILPSAREATFGFQSNLARVRLKFSARTDSEVEKLILAYDLEIIPVLMQFKPHDELVFPLDKVDREAVAHWIEDRLMDFLDTYLAMGQNEFYLKDHMVVDPIANVRLPRFAAAATIERGGDTYYFISEETRREFAEKNKIPLN